MILSIKTETIIKDSKKLEDVFDSSDLDENHEVFSEKNKKVFGKFKIETRKNFCIGEFVCLRSKAYSFKCKHNNENKNKMKGISKSQSNHIKFEEYYNCLFGREYQKECDNYFIRSNNHEMYLQKVRNITLSLFDDKRCYKNETESKPWENIYNFIIVIMLNCLYCLIIVFYEIYLYEFVMSDGCHNIYLFLICHKHDNNF